MTGGEKVAKGPPSAQQMRRYAEDSRPWWCASSANDGEPHRMNRAVLLK